MKERDKKKGLSAIINTFNIWIGPHEFPSQLVDDLAQCAEGVNEEPLKIEPEFQSVVNPNSPTYASLGNTQRGPLDYQYLYVDMAPYFPYSGEGLSAVDVARIYTRLRHDDELCAGTLKLEMAIALGTQDNVHLPDGETIFDRLESVMYHLQRTGANLVSITRPRGAAQVHRDGKLLNEMSHEELAVKHVIVFSLDYLDE